MQVTDDQLREKCGVFGIFGHNEATILTALGLHALQHRGQEACGIASFDGEFYSERHLGLVGDNFASKELPERLPGFAAIGHNRYSTQGKTVRRNIQPIYADLASGGIAMAHNGNITNSRSIREKLIQEGAIFQTTMDTEVVIQLLARSSQKRMTDRFIDAVSQIQGGFALVALTTKKLIGARDPTGLRPLVIGKLGDAFVLASETCALDSIHADFIREVRPGEVVVISDSGLESFKVFGENKVRPCVFEYVYFSRPDSVIQGRSVYEVRRKMGHELAKETNIEADIVVPVPDSGVPAALGYAEKSDLPYQMGIIRNHYVGRTFIQPTQAGRKSSVSRKHSPNHSVLNGKRVILIDDSIVRGNTSERIVEMVRGAGAKEVHFLSASPPIKFPDFYGIDMPTKEELLASFRSHEEMTKFLKADSLQFLSLDGLYRAIEGEGRNPDNPHFADHCFTGDYPTNLIDHDNAKSSKDFQLSFLHEDY